MGHPDDHMGRKTFDSSGALPVTPAIVITRNRSWHHLTSGLPIPFADAGARRDIRRGLRRRRVVGSMEAASRPSPSTWSHRGRREPTELPQWNPNHWRQGWPATEGRLRLRHLPSATPAAGTAPGTGLGPRIGRGSTRTRAGEALPGATRRGPRRAPSPSRRSGQSSGPHSHQPSMSRTPRRPRPDQAGRHRSARGGHRAPARGWGRRDSGR